MTKIYTVSTGKYRYGVFALINSLRQLEIMNEVIVGTDSYIPEIEHIADVSQVILNSDWNGVNLKSLLILEHPSETFIFFDADIIITNADFITELEHLLAANKFIACIDGIVSQNEYRRLYWAEIYPSPYSITQHCWYYNSGFFAGTFDLHRQTLIDWQELNSRQLDPKAYLFAHPKLPMADQDTFNAVLQTLPLSSMATIQMPDWRAINMTHHPFFHIGNFRPHAFLHCTGKSKPWDIKSIPARSPTAYDDLWYRYLFTESGPIKSSLTLSFFQKQWFNRTILSRGIIKLKKTFL